MLFVCELFFIEGRGHSRRMMVMGKGVLEHGRWSGSCSSNYDWKALLFVRFVQLWTLQCLVEPYSSPMATFEFGERVSIASRRFSQLQRQLPPRGELYSSIWIQLTRDARVLVKRKFEMNNAALRDYINLHLFNGY